MNPGLDEAVDWEAGAWAAIRREREQRIYEESLNDGEAVRALRTEETG